jgi:ABC-type Co2+ transport system permease subunit
MKLAERAGKSVVLILAGAFIFWFVSDLLNVPANGSLLEKLILMRPVVLTIRISLIFVALGIVGFIIAIFWKQIGILKIGSSGIEFGKLDKFSSETDADLAAKSAKIKELEAQIELIINERDELKARIKAMDPRMKGAKK